MKEKCREGKRKKKGWILRLERSKVTAYVYRRELLVQVVRDNE